MTLAERLEGARKRKAAGLQTWFRRESYHGAYSSEPKWHLFEDWQREKNEDGSWGLESQWVAKCGYAVRFNLAFTLGYPMLRHDIKTKKKRCSKCEKRLEKEKSNG